MRSLPIFAAATLLAACGTRGPLVLPPNPQTPTPPAQTAPADNSSSKTPAGAAR